MRSIANVCPSEIDEIDELLGQLRSLRKSPSLACDDDEIEALRELCESLQSFAPEDQRDEALELFVTQTSVESVRTKSLPPLTAGVDKLRSPSEFRASSSNESPVESTATSPRAETQ